MNNCYSGGKRKGHTAVSTTETLRVVVAAPLKPEHAQLIREREPRIELVWHPELVHQMRFPADFVPAPDFARSDEDQRRFEELLDGADAIYGIPDTSAAALRRTVQANPKLRWVHTMAAGGGGQVKAADLSDADLQRVVFTTSAGVHGRPLAEFAVFGVFAGAKHLPRLTAQQKQHVWSDRWTMGQVSSQTALVYGLGGIGQEVARLLSAMGMRVIGVSRRTDREVPHIDRLVTPDEAPQVAAEVDAVICALPGTAETTNMLGEDLFRSVKPGATVVNVGRGTAIDEQALIAALDSGRVGFAALDVFAVEPLPDDSPLWDHPNVVVAPHTAALTDGEEQLIASLFAENATRLLDRQPLRNQVDTVEFY